MCRLSTATTSIFMLELHLTPQGGQRTKLRKELMSILNPRPDGVPSIGDLSLILKCLATSLESNS